MRLIEENSAPSGEKMGEKRCSGNQELFQKLSVSLQRSNAALIVDRDVPERVNDNEHLLA